jgi:hypothetical protein
MSEAYIRSLWTVLDRDGDIVRDQCYHTREEAEENAKVWAKEDEELGPFTIYTMTPTVYFALGEVQRVPVHREGPHAT